MTYETYQQAQEAVDLLARADFPVDQLSIVGSDLKTVERVTGKLSWGRVAIAGAATGAWLGMFFGLLLVIFSSATSLGFVLAAILIGAGFGMLFGLVSYGINRRRRDFTSVMQVIATSYSVIADHDLGNRARNVLESHGSVAPVQHPADPRTRNGGVPFAGGPDPVEPQSRAENGGEQGGGRSPAGDGGDAAQTASSAPSDEQGATPARATERPRYGEYAPEAERPRYGENPPADDQDRSER